MRIIKNKSSNNSILVAEDDSSIRKFYRVILAKNGFDIHEAENGKEALSLYTAVVPNLIITDINMPIMNGLEFIQNIRRIDNGIPIIAASTDELLLKVALKHGANEMYSKTSSITNLIKSVNSLIGI